MLLIVLLMAGATVALDDDLFALLHRHYRVRSGRWYRPTSTNISCFSMVSDAFIDTDLVLDGGRRFGGRITCDVRLPPNVIVEFTALDFKHPKSNARVEAGNEPSVPAVFSKSAYKSVNGANYGPWKLPCKYVFVSLNPQAKAERLHFSFHRPSSRQMHLDPGFCTF